MKKYSPIHKAILFSTLFIIAALTGGCEKEEAVNPPTIEYVRLLTATDPITFANLGESVAIIGTNLSTAKNITFNGTPAAFYGTMATDNSIVTSVSKLTPFEGEAANNKVVVETEGGTVEFTLEIAPPAPTIDGISPQSAGAGAVIKVMGSYFYNIESATIDGVLAEIISVTPDIVKIKVPEGVASGLVKITSSKSGMGTSKMNFGVNNGEIVANWGAISPSNGSWWNNSIDGPSDAFAPLGNSYKYIDATFGNTWWTHDGGINFDATNHRKGNPAEKAFRFEYASKGDVPGIQILWKSSMGEYKYVIQNFQATNGDWATYTIKMSDFTLGDSGPAMSKEVFEADNPVLVQFAFINTGDADITTKFATTNIRIVNY